MDIIEYMDATFADGTTKSMPCVSLGICLEGKWTTLTAITSKTATTNLLGIDFLKFCSLNTISEWASVAELQSKPYVGFHQISNQPGE